MDGCLSGTGYIPQRPIILPIASINPCVGGVRIINNYFVMCQSIKHVWRFPFFGTENRRIYKLPAPAARRLRPDGNRL